MTPGQLARAALGRHFEAVGNAYRRIFVNLERIVDVYDAALPQRAKILDIGGGDGALIDRLLNRRPDLEVSMCDPAPAIGAFLSERNRDRVHLAPGTNFENMVGSFDAVTISDVIHHVPVGQRDEFFASLAQSCERWRCRTIVLKDVEPKSFRGLLSLLSDHFVTGDKQVVLFSRQEFGIYAARHFGKASRTSMMPDWPNYCEVLSW